MKDRWEESIFRMAAQEQIMLPRHMSERIEEILCKPKNRAFRMNWKKSVVLAAAMIVLVSATAVASAGALRERMEAMNREKLEAYFTQIYTSKTGADNYNRAYFDTEKERMRALRESYEGEARFPEKELTMIEEASEYKGRGVAFLGDTSTFFFPEKEMSDEELLEIIDFMHKRDYSLQKMNEMIETGEAQLPQLDEEEVQATGEDILATDAVYEPTQSLTIPYTGELELDLTIAAGRNELFLAGYNSVHRMEIGSSNSEVFFDDFDEETRVLAMCQDQSGDLYMAVWELTAAEAENASAAGAESAGGNVPAAEAAAAGQENEAAVRRTLAVWVADRDGKLLRRIDLAEYIDPGRQGMIRRMAIDGSGRLYLNTTGLRSLKENQECGILVLDREGGYVTRIAPDEYMLRKLGGLGVGKDGRVYTYIEDCYDPDSTKYRRGIAALDVEKGTLGDIYFDIMPENTSLPLDIVAQGAESDFVFWGYDGIYTYDLGDESAVCVLPPYEAPCGFEGARYCALSDGRIVLTEVLEYRTEEYALGKKFLAVPEKTCFYYVPGVRTE